MQTPSYFGRTWKVTVTPQATGETWTVANSDWASESLKVTFDIFQAATFEWWYGDITVWNLAPGIQDLIQAGDLVTVSAGYQRPQSANPLVFQGRVSQPLWERSDDSMDFRLTLHCNVGKFQDDNGQVSVSLEAGLTDAQAVQRIADVAGIKVVSLDPSLSASSTIKTRGLSYFGTARFFFDLVAQSHQLNGWIDWNGLTIQSLAPQGETPNLIYAPPLSPNSTVSTTDGLKKYTLLGSPQQTEQGVAFRVLLDSELTLGTLVKLDFATLRKLRLAPLQLPVRADKDGLYAVAGIRHVGDTRGNDWFSEVIAVTRGWSQIFGTVLR